MHMTNCLLNQLSRPKGLRQSVADAARLDIELTIVRISSSRRIETFWLRYPVLKFGNGGEFPSLGCITRFINYIIYHLRLKKSTSKYRRRFYCHRSSLFTTYIFGMFSISLTYPWHVLICLIFPGSIFN